MGTRIFISFYEGICNWLITVVVAGTGYKWTVKRRATCNLSRIWKSRADFFNLRSKSPTRVIHYNTPNTFSTLVMVIFITTRPRKRCEKLWKPRKAVKTPVADEHFIICLSSPKLQNRLVLSGWWNTERSFRFSFWLTLEIIPLSSAVIVNCFLNNCSAWF